MATLSTQDFTALVRNMVASVQSAASTLVDLTAGSVLRAILEAVAAVVLWLQGLIVYILTLTRAATSSDDDLDSWMADYDFPRQDAKSATGNVTMGRYTATAQAIVPVGATVQTGDGTEKFDVIADTTNAAYNATVVTGGGYVLAAGISSISVPVVAENAGTEGNVQAGTITFIYSGIAGIDTVTNASAFANGADAEEDDAYRARFVLYMASLSKATNVAVKSAVANVGSNLTYTLTENYTYGGVYQPGFFYVVVDDGTGAPTSTLLNTVANAIEAMRGTSIQFAVFAPVVVTANATMVLTTASGYAHATVVGNVTTALRSFINALPLGTPLPYTQLAAVA